MPFGVPGLRLRARSRSGARSSLRAASAARSRGSLPLEPAGRLVGSVALTVRRRFGPAPPSGRPPLPAYPSPDRGHRFPAELIAHAGRLSLRLALGFRNVEELPAERVVAVAYATARRRVASFGAQYAEALRRRAPTPGRTWHLDGMAARIGGTPRPRRTSSAGSSGAWAGRLSGAQRLASARSARPAASR